MQCPRCKDERLREVILILEVEGAYVNFSLGTGFSLAGIARRRKKVLMCLGCRFEIGRCKKRGALAKGPV